MKKLNKLYKNIIIQNCYQNPYMSFNSTSNNQQNKKQIRSLQQFENLCKNLGLYTSVNNDLYQKDDKYIIINLFIFSDNKNQKNKFEFHNNSKKYHQQNKDKFDKIHQFLNKYIITKQGKKQYPIYIIG